MTSLMTRRWQTTTSTISLKMSLMVRSTNQPTNATNHPGPSFDQGFHLKKQSLTIITASKLPAKARATNIKPTVASLSSLAYENGVLPSALDQLVDLVTTPNYLDQASLAAIVRNLYPAERVSPDVVLRVVSALGHGTLKASLSLQAALLKWLVMVYHVLSEPVVLAQVYSVLFNLLDTAAIRPQLAHLLALITRRRHVRPFRIQAL